MTRPTKKLTIVCERKKTINGITYYRYSTPTHPRRSKRRQIDYSMQSIDDMIAGSLSGAESYINLSEYKMLLVYPVSRSAEIERFFGVEA